MSGGPVVPDIRAVWQANTVFSPGDVFTYLGGVYEVTTTYTSGASFGATDLANTTLWEAQSGAYAFPRGVWTPVTVYAVGDLVVNGGYAYRALVSHTSGASFAVGTNWEPWGNPSLRSMIPTLEELSQTTVVGAVAATTTTYLWVAPFTATIAQLSLANSAAIATSDTNYWTVALTRYRAGAAVTIATATTQTTGGNGAVAANQAWTFDALAWDVNNRILQKGDVLALTFTATGSPTAWAGTIASFRYEPTALGTGPFVSDTFTRATNNATLGNAETGQPWQPLTGIWGVNASGAANVTTVSGGRDVAVVETGLADCTVQATLTLIGAHSSGVTLRVTDASNFFFASAFSLNRVTAGVNNNLGGYSSTLSIGDSVKVVMTGSQFKVYKISGGVTTLILTVTDTQGQTNTRHGLYSGADAAGGNTVDNFTVVAN